MHEDTITIEAIRQGDRQRYGELVDRYERQIYAIAWSRLGDIASSEDAVQETFVRGFRYLAALRNPERFGTWITRIAHSVSSTIGRCRRRELEGLRRWQLTHVPALAGAQNPGSDDLPTQELLSDALAKLSPSNRECLVLFYLKGQGIRASARALGVSESSFKTRLHRARTALRVELESQLGPALERLEPSTTSRACVLAAIPPAPFGWESGVPALTGIGGAVNAALLPLLKVVPTMLLVGWASRGLARNYREGSAFRGQIIRWNYVLLLLVVVGVVMLTGWARAVWGNRAVNVALGIILLPAFAQSLLSLRVHANRFYVATAIGTGCLSIAFLGMGLLELPFFVFAAAMVVYNGLLLWSRRAIPLRSDYNLFLRAQTGGLGFLPSDAKPGQPCAEADLQGFSRFLGERLLIVDRSIRGLNHVLYLPPIKNSFVAAFVLPLARFNGSSTLTLGPDGSCRAALSGRDARHLATLAPKGAFDGAALQAHVTGAVQASLACFQAGRCLDSSRILSAQHDEAVFVRPPHTLPSMRTLFAVSLAASVVGMVMFVLVYLQKVST